MRLTNMDTKTDKPTLMPRKSQALLPGMKSLTLKIPEDLKRDYRVGAIQAGLENDEFFAVVWAGYLKSKNH